MLSQADLDVIFARLVDVRDATPESEAEALLARIVLLLADLVDERHAVLTAVDRAAAA